jgi:hypothetical protein
VNLSLGCFSIIAVIVEKQLSLKCYDSAGLIRTYNKESKTLSIVAFQASS